MIGMSRVSTTMVRAGQVVVPRGLSAGQQVTSASVTMPSGPTRLAVEFDLSATDQVDPQREVTITNEVSLDAGQSWIAWGSATTRGSATRPAGRQPQFAVRPAPPVGALVRQRVICGGQPVSVGHVVRWV